MSAATLTRGASWATVPGAGEARTHEGERCADILTLLIGRGLYDGSALLADIDAAPDRDVAIRDHAERMVREADEADAYNGRAVESAAQWGAEHGYKVWAPRKLPTARRKRSTAQILPVRVAFEPMGDADAERQHMAGEAMAGWPAHYARASTARRKIENTPGIAWRVYPVVPTESSKQAEYKRARAEIDAWLADAPRTPRPTRQTPAATPTRGKRDAAPADVVIVAETVAAAPDPAPAIESPDPVPMADVVPIRPGVVPADPAPAAIDSPRQHGADGDPVADYLARLIHAPKRAFAEALLRGENPPDPGRPWADKVRRTLSRYGAI